MQNKENLLCHEHIFFSITEDELQIMRYGCLGWLMWVIPQHLVTCKLYRTVQQLLYCLLSRHILAGGTIVHSDQWASYSQVSRLPNVSQHETVNHSVEFISPTGIHTQNVESYWNRVKTKIKRMKGCHEQQLASYLDEFMYRERHKQTAYECFNSIIRDIANQYPV